MTTTPEWYLAISALATLSALAILWTPMLIAVPLLVLAILLPAAQSGFGAARASFTSHGSSRLAEFKLRLITTFLYIVQPAARLSGRLQYGLTPWRWRGPRAFSFPWPGHIGIWSERRLDPGERLHSIEQHLRTSGASFGFGSFLICFLVGSPNAPQMHRSSNPPQFANLSIRACCLLTQPRIAADAVAIALIATGKISRIEGTFRTPRGNC